MAMAMYAIATAPMIQQLQKTFIYQVWFADDCSTTPTFPKLKSWWDQLTHIGPNFQNQKSWLIVKQDKYDQACFTFEGIGIKINTDGQRYFWGSLGTASFAESYTQSKIAIWEKELTSLCNIAISQPQAAYAAFTHGLVHKWSFLSCTIPNIGHLFQPLETIIRDKLIPALTRKHAVSDEIRNLLTLPVRLGGLGIAISVQQAQSHYQTSKNITSTISSMLKEQAMAILQK